MNCRCDVTIQKGESVITAHRLRLIGEAKLVQCAIEPIPGPITSEHTPSPVTTVCSRSEADNQQPRGGTSQARYRTSPILPILKSPSFADCDLLPVFDQARTASAIDNFGLREKSRRLCHALPRPLVYLCDVTAGFSSNTTSWPSILSDGGCGDRSLTH